jgi:hypothetical protein
MMTLRKPSLLVLAALMLCPGPLFAVSPKYEGALKARISNGYVFIVLANGSRAVVGLALLSPDDQAFLTALSQQAPMAKGNSVVTVVREKPVIKNTIAVSTKVGPLETVQLNPPNVFRDQIGATCMVYARVHWLDIAGFYMDVPEIYKIINNADPNEPWKNPGYYSGMEHMFLGFRPFPWVHNWSPRTDAFEWTREELRKGRPVLASFPREVWQALPPGFVGQHPWSGGNVGHQVVVNGFTWNAETHSGTFHIVNSWKELPEFDLKSEMAAGGVLVIEQSLSPKGEVPEASAATVITKITLIKAIGNTNLYEAETNNGPQRVAAPDEASARATIESASPNQ